MEMTPDVLALGLIWFAVFLFSVTLHEAAHAWAALRLGDDTAYLGGQVTLNPVPHVVREPIGTIVLPIVSYALSGWMMGWASAPYDPTWASRFPKRAAWMALAGPVSNLLVALLAGLGLWLGLARGVFVPPQSLDYSRLVAAASDAGPTFEGLAALGSILFALNLLLFVFNLLPLPPLDGASILPLVLPEGASRAYLDFMRQPGFGLLGILVAWNVFPTLFGPVFRVALDLVYSAL
ncbi:MAG: site-2 protease family protein [Acidobacteriota bacterium]